MSGRQLQFTGRERDLGFALLVRLAFFLRVGLDVHLLVGAVSVSLFVGVIQVLVFELVLNCLLVLAQHTLQLQIDLLRFGPYQFPLLLSVAAQVLSTFTVILQYLNLLLLLLHFLHLQLH